MKHWKLILGAIVAALVVIYAHDFIHMDGGRSDSWRRKLGLSKLGL